MRKLFLLLLLISTTLYSQNCTDVVVYMYDSYGDGWNGNTLTVGDNSLTLITGAEGIDTICVDLNECNTIEVGGGSYGGEVSWTINELEGSVGSFLLGDCSSADIEGCTDSLALNYNENANVDNDSCQYPLLDCNGSDVTNITSWIGDGYCDNGIYSYLGNPVYFDCEEFNWDEGDCPDPNAEILGCIDSSAFNFNPDANTDDGSCLPVVEGCTNDTALNFDPEANVENFTCEFPIFGCTDPGSPNYNPLAEADNGSCVNGVCSDGEAKMILQITLDQFPGETGWILTDISTGQPVANVVGGEYDYSQANTTIPYELCVPTTGVELILSDDYGDGMQGSLYNGGTDGNFIILADTEPCGDGLDTVWALPEVGFGVAIYSGPIWLPYCEIPPIYGCMDNNFLEYDLAANVNVPEDCQTEKIYGCTDDSQFNYDPNANSLELISPCNYTITIEDDASDGWGDSYLAVFHGEQEWIYTLGPGIEEQSWNIQLESDKSVEVYYFQVQAPQQPIQEVLFQTMHNSFTIVRDDGVELLSGGVNPFEDNGAGALQPFQPPFWNVYSALPYCGDICEPIVYGCTEQFNWQGLEMFNYDPLANTYDFNVAPCIPVLEGCTDSTLYGYNANATTDDGSCQPWIIGCTDEQAWNYNSLANLNDATSCLYFGCMDPAADNYDPNANVELEGACFTTILGCTDPNAFNYNEEANTDDFTCIDIIYGCMDTEALNYSIDANTEDGSCIEILEGCMDETAYNYDAFANLDNASCLYDAGCIDGPGEPYWLNDSCYAWVIAVDPNCCNYQWDIKCEGLYDYCQVQNGLNISELLQHAEVVIYPNPFKDVVNIITNKEIELDVYDINGRLIIKVKSNQLHKEVNQLDVSQLPNGVYNFVVTYEGKSINKKVIKQ